MKHNHNHDNAPNAGTQTVPLRVKFSHPTAVSVSIAGTFNQCKPESKILHPSGEGHWLKETALMPGTYQYCVVVDGQWRPDPPAQETVPNPHGGRNSVLRVAGTVEATHLGTAEPHDPQ